MCVGVGVCVCRYRWVGGCHVGRASVDFFIGCKEGMCLFSHWIHDHLWILVCLFFHCQHNQCGYYAFPSQGMCHEMATKGTGKGLEPQMQEYGCRK